MITSNLEVNVVWRDYTAWKLVHSLNKNNDSNDSDNNSSNDDGFIQGRPK